MAWPCASTGVARRVPASRPMQARRSMEVILRRAARTMIGPLGQETSVPMTNRRQFLETLAAAGAASLVPSSHLFGQGRVAKLNVRGGAIDVHHHFVPPGGTTNRPWSPQLSLEQMDKFGIGVAILSMTQNGELLYNGTEKGRAAVRAGNEYGAKLMQQYPKKFGLMGGIPMPDLEGALREVEYAYDTLKVDAIGIYTNDNQGR